MQRARIRDGLGGGAHVGFGDDFQERCAGAIEVDAGHAFKVFVQRFAGVFFKVRARDAHGFFGVADLDRQRAAFDDRDRELADLIALGQVGIEIILAVEYVVAVDGRTERQPQLDRAFDRAAIQYRQHARQRDVHCARLCVRCRTIGDAAAGKYFRVRRELGMDLQADNNFPLH